ncbi:MAG: hypothetical protein AABY32_00540 [Nanoarchaeota archaeon]
MNNFKKNRKGFMLAEETLKMVVAVICIIFLIYILVAVYNSNASAKKIEEAKDILLRIEGIVNNLEEGAIENQDIPNPKGWHLYSFIGEEKPNSCLNDNCLCICDSILIKMIKSQEKKCDEKGACLAISNLATAELDLKIRNVDELLFIRIKKQDGGILIGELK